MRTLRGPAALLAAAALLLSGAATASAATWVDRVREATSPFQHLSVAKDAGYARFKDADGIACIASDEGGMGTHFVNGKLVSDAKVLPRHPEALVYQPMGNGHRRLVALEYIVVKKAWRASHPTGRPRVGGHRLHLVTAPNRYGLPAFYELHVWAFKDNPRGMFYEWNPRVTCP